MRGRGAAASNLPPLPATTPPTIFLAQGGEVPLPLPLCVQRVRSKVRGEGEPPPPLARLGGRRAPQRGTREGGARAPLSDACLGGCRMHHKGARGGGGPPLCAQPRAWWAVTQDAFLCAESGTGSWGGARERSCSPENLIFSSDGGE